jgi:hypothetical protein
MNLPPNRRPSFASTGPTAAGARGPARPQGRNGSSVLVVLVLLGAMSVILLANSITLRWLKAEILRVEQQQQQKSHGPSADH